MTSNETNPADKRPFRVLSLDGGGMRGTYTATYLDRVATAFARRRLVTGIDVGKAFDLIVGTSTGGIIACGLAKGVPLSTMVDLYRRHGADIFPKRLPEGAWGVPADVLRRGAAIHEGAGALQKALAAILEETTLADVYARRGIALAITSVEMSQHRSWVFKTPHLKTSNGRDNGYSLVDICMATSAAPIFRSLAAIDHPDGGTGFNVFVDGGLWANNPVLIGLIDALEMTKPGDSIQIFCLGTCPVPAGEQISKGDLDRGLAAWKFGGVAAELSIDAQAFAFDNMARMLARHLDRDCQVIRFPADKVPAALLPYLSLDDTREQAMNALVNQARSDADMTNSRCGNDRDEVAKAICALFEDAPVLPEGDAGQSSPLPSKDHKRV
ncbi:CBASS cGAMP-activated phospholipase [Sphingomonas aurantiaca]|uniref:CBASS cGAMP-activated phospholipase n=1 Tax=Sphingomonas aurantiaca TaxID=185949 RepID=UPI00336132E9